MTIFENDVLIYGIALAAHCCVAVNGQTNDILPNTRENMNALCVKRRGERRDTENSAGAQRTNEVV